MHVKHTNRTITYQNIIVIAAGIKVAISANTLLKNILYFCSNNNSNYYYYSANNQVPKKLHKKQPTEKKLYNKTSVQTIKVQSDAIIITDLQCSNCEKKTRRNAAIEANAKGMRIKR